MERRPFHFDFGGILQWKGEVRFTRGSELRGIVNRVLRQLVSDSEVRTHLAAGSDTNFGIEDTSNSLNLVWLWFRSPQCELAATMLRTSEPPHW
jgi:hypothetical protein